MSIPPQTDQTAEPRPAPDPAVTATGGSSERDMLSINTLRTLSIDMVQQANSGHPGLPMGAAPMAYALFTRHLRFDPTDPTWANRDRFILSAGHGSALLYALLHMAGYDLTIDDLKQFRQFGSKTPGHPEIFLTPGVEMTTGPLGQGFGNGVGMAMAEAHLRATFGRDGRSPIDHHIYALVSDGDLMEGVASEAASLAGHLKLGRLIYLYDDNHISLDGPTSLAFTEDRMKRFDAYGWHTQQVEDGNDVDAISRAIDAAKADERPSIIAVRTIIGFGSPNKADSSKAHGSPLGPDEVKLTKEAYDWPVEPTFLVPDGARDPFTEAAERGQTAHAEWTEQLDRYRTDHSDEAASLIGMIRGDLPDGWADDLPTYTTADKKATRETSGACINAMAPKLPALFGGSADLSGSNDTMVKNRPNFTPDDYAGRNVWFGVREHGMGAALNGMSTYGLIPYGGTFLTFSDYMRGSIRLAALSGHGVIYVFTHDSIGLGEDGPTHQSIEHLAALRAMPGLRVLRPADGNETAALWRGAIEHRTGPSAFVLSRQKLPTFSRDGLTDDASRGAYILADADGGTPDIILMGSGSEVQWLMGAREILSGRGVKVRVVSFPSWELFEAQDAAYREKVLPKSVRKRLSVEAAVPMGWERYTGSDGAAFGVTRFGMSAPAETLFEQYGFTSEFVAKLADAVLSGEPMPEPPVASLPMHHAAPAATLKPGA